MATILLTILALFTLVGLFRSHRHLSSLAFRSTMGVTHTVLFQFNAAAEPGKVAAVSVLERTPPVLQKLITQDVQACARFLSLRDSCVHPTTKAAYITSLKGGKDNSPEGLQVRTPSIQCSSFALLGS